MDRTRRASGSGAGRTARLRPAPRISPWMPPRTPPAPTPRPMASTSCSSTATGWGTNSSPLVPPATAPPCRSRRSTSPPCSGQGHNTVRAVLTDGWFRGSFGFTRDADMYGTQTALLAQLEMQSGGARTVIGTDRSWLYQRNGDPVRGPDGGPARGLPGCGRLRPGGPARRPAGTQPGNPDRPRGPAHPDRGGTGPRFHHPPRQRTPGGGPRPEHQRLGRGCRSSARPAPR